MRATWGKRWSAKELELVKKWQEQSVTGSEQAKRLGRSYASWCCFVRRRKLQKHCPQYNYRPEYRSMVIDLLNRGFRVGEIARHMNLGHAGVSRIVTELIKQGLVEKLQVRGHYKVTKLWNQ